MKSYFKFGYELINTLGFMTLLCSFSKRKTNFLIVKE